MELNIFENNLNLQKDKIGFNYLSFKKFLVPAKSNSIFCCKNGENISIDSAFIELLFENEFWLSGHAYDDTFYHLAKNNVFEIDALLEFFIDFKTKKNIYFKQIEETYIHDLNDWFYRCFGRSLIFSVIKTLRKNINYREILDIINNFESRYSKSEFINKGKHISAVFCFKRKIHKTIKEISLNKF